jgi:hypothetical protein
VRIDNTGDVGIGTTSPTARLNVVDATSQDAVRITQTGSGNALVVEDSANPDSSPFVIDTSGNVVVGKTTADASFGLLQTHGTGAFQFGSASYANNANATIFQAAKSRGASVGTQTVVQSGDDLFSFRGLGSDGTGFIRAGQINISVDGTPGTNDMPGRITFSTTADGSATPTERMRINSSGYVGIGTNNPQSELEIGVASGAGTLRFSVAGSLQGSVFASTASMAVGTFANIPLIFNTNNTEKARITEAGNLQFNSGYGSVATAFGCRAWVNFNGTGTPAIRASGNVSSITDHTTGDYTVNFTNAMPDANYSVTGMVDANNAGGESLNINDTQAAPTTTTVRVQSSRFGAAFDATYVCVAIFR